jgi:hypothetical protein
LGEIATSRTHRRGRLALGALHVPPAILVFDVRAVGVNRCAIARRKLIILRRTISWQYDIKACTASAHHAAQAGGRNPYKIINLDLLCALA